MEMCFTMHELHLLIVACKVAATPEHRDEYLKLIERFQAERARQNEFTYRNRKTS